MKKLMIAACAVALAAAAQAANINWGLSGVTASPDGGNLDDYYVYTYVSSDSSGQSTVFSTADILKMIQDGEDPYEILDAAYGDDKGSGYLSATGNYNNTSTKGINATGADTENSIVMHSYAIILDTDDVETAKYYQVVDLGETTFKNPGATGLASGTAANDWKLVAVPEPTSGLLLLLGVAGLALRRRRA